MNAVPHDPSRDVEDVRRTLALYCQLCDDGRFDEFALLFTEDAEFRVMGRTYAGRDGVKDFMAAAQPPERRGKHVATNSVIDVYPESMTARAWTDYIFVARDPAADGGGAGFIVQSVGRYHDTLVREDDGVWRFVSREIVFMGEGTAENQPAYR